MSSIECPRCMDRRDEDLAQPASWREQHGVRAEGWLHPSGQYPGLLHCNCCGDYYCRAQAQNFITGTSGLLYVPRRELVKWAQA